MQNGASQLHGRITITVSARPPRVKTPVSVHVVDQRLYLWEKTQLDESFTNSKW